MYPSKAQNHHIKKLSLVNSDESDQYETKNNPLEYDAFLDGNPPISKFCVSGIKHPEKLEHSKDEFSTVSFKGPLDDFMRKVVGDRILPNFKDSIDYSKGQGSCDMYLKYDSDIQYTNCQLELQGLKESLSSYSLSSLRQV